MGLPRLIKKWQTDVGEPLSLQDSDFDRATTCMPASRPETGLTPILYRIVKARMMTAIGHVWDFAADTRSYDYTQVIEMDKELQKTYMSIPDCLKWRSMNHCITDSPQVIIQKIHLDIMFQKAKIVLHRRYMNFSLTKTEYDQSQKSGLDAALKLLEYQSILHEETQPGCQLYHERWRVTSIVNHDFLLATSILCFSLKKSSHENCEELETSVVETVQASLKRSHRVWANLSNSSKEAQKAADALTVVLGGHQAYPKAETYAFEQIKTSPSYTADHYQQDTVTSFGIRFPIFNFDDWSSPMNEDVFEDFLAPITAMNEEWQGDEALMDTRDQTN
ncbi:hypothetical protein HYALB_00007719 [Hymenoscyphus albidus]|uniref:Uncharacterized protein n=1 Tax=Hymenoscyphus albidus TaxID=595503 RepID=A0A9N9Q2J0_9HELO|nr:hypothetical protein HYALB_00007719 [Hymenoscyphus albidus]